jgi:hypothetical protein
MPKLQINGTTLAVAVLGAVFGFTLLPGPFTWLASAAGLVLALILLGYDREGYRSLVESLGFAAAVSLCLTLAAGGALRLAADTDAQRASFEGRIGGEWMPLIWAGATILLWIIDRARMSGRMQYGATVQYGAPAQYAAPVQYAAPATAAPSLFTPAPPPPPPEPARASRAEPAAAPIEPRATFTQPSFGHSTEEPASEPVAQYVAPAAPLPDMARPAPPPAPPPLPAVATPAIPSGKETTVYVTLVGEGLNVLRAVRAEHLGRDFYKIIEQMPEGETWQFGPGQVVRCKKKNLSSGKAMVATEEAPRAR